MIMKSIYCKEAVFSKPAIASYSKFGENQSFLIERARHPKKGCSRVNKVKSFAENSVATLLNYLICLHSKS